jgi:tRNA1Val (adenine37-N6)-methyltransferase
LEPQGRFTLILPTQTAEQFITHALANGWYIVRTCKVFTVAHKPSKRLLLTLSRVSSDTIENETLVLQEKTGGRTAEYASLCADFYLPKKD